MAAPGAAASLGHKQPTEGATDVHQPDDRPASHHPPRRPVHYGRRRAPRTPSAPRPARRAPIHDCRPRPPYLVADVRPARTGLKEKRMTRTVTEELDEAALGDFVHRFITDLGA